MAEWVTGTITQVQHWTENLFSITLQAPVHNFTAGQFAKLGLDIDGEREQRAYSYVNAPSDNNLEFYLVTVPDGKLSPRLHSLQAGDTLQVTERFGCWQPVLHWGHIYQFCKKVKISSALRILS